MKSVHSDGSFALDVILCVAGALLKVILWLPGALAGMALLAYAYYPEFTLELLQGIASRDAGTITGLLVQTILICAWISMAFSFLTCKPCNTCAEALYRLAEACQELVKQARHYAKKALTSFNRPNVAQLGLAETVSYDAPDATGVVIGGINGKPLIDTSMLPVAILGKARSGKTCSFIVPTLLTWKDSAIVTDARGETYGITAGWRQGCANNRIHCIAFCDPESPDTFNFLDAIPWGSEDEYSATRHLARLMLDDFAPLEDFDKQCTVSIAVVLLAMVIQNVHQVFQTHASLHHAWQFVSAGPQSLETMITMAIADAPSAITQSDIKLLSLCLKNKDIERRAREAVLSSLCAFRYPEVARNTSTSTFSLRELNEEGSKTTVYLNYSPRNASEALPLIRIFTGLVIASRQSTDIYGRLLLALDDFSVSGCARLLDFSMPDLVSRNIKPALTFHHLDNSLGAIWKKSSIRSVLQVINYETAELVSRELSGASPVSGQAFTSQDIMRLDEEEAIIVGCSEQPFQASTYPYYKDAAMLSKLGNRCSTGET